MDKALLDTYLKAYPARMLKDAEGNDSGIVVSMPCRVQWPHLVEPQQTKRDDGSLGEPEYNIALLIPAGADVSLLQAEGRRVGIAKFGETKAKAFSQENKLGLRLQASKAEFDGFAEEGFFMSCSTKFNNFGPYGVGGKGDKLDPKEIYPGCWVIAKLQAYPFDNKNKGVKFGLRGLQKIADDERLREGNADSGDGFEPIAGVGSPKKEGAVTGANDGW